MMATEQKSPYFDRIGNRFRRRLDRVQPPDSLPRDLRHTLAHPYSEQHPGDLLGLARILGTKVKTQRKFTPASLLENWPGL
jgi:hypothetical protein